MSASGHSIALDFGIGNAHYLGKGLGARTLLEFIDFYRGEVDSSADTFFIDPDENNPRAAHVYDQAGFQKIGEYDVKKGAFVGGVNCLMVKKI